MAKNYITVVSGLPRSGTSMMMRMLDMAGMPVLVDGERQADTDNPNGYYEYEPVKSLRSDQSWLSHAEGKAVKIIYLLLYALPKQYSYRVIFMKRNMDEVLKSQRVMLQRAEKAISVPDDKVMGDMFENHLREFEEWALQQDNVKVVYVDYNQIVRDGGTSCGEVADFLDGEVAPESMIKVLDPSLYRQQAG